MNTNARVLHLGQVIVDLTMYIDRLPERGGDVFANRSGIQAGGGFNVLNAISQMGVTAVYCGGIGCGQMADIVRGALERVGVVAAGPQVAGVDTGYCIAMTEADGERTFVSTRGAECLVPPDAYTKLAIQQTDVLYLSGYSLAHDANRLALENMALALFEQGWVRGAVPVVFDVGPLADTLPMAALLKLNRLGLIWSINEREGRLLVERFALADSLGGSLNSPDEPDEAESIDAVRCRALAGYLGSVVVLRAGARGAWLCDGASADHHDACSLQVTHIPTPAVQPVDTNGAGDAHSGALCAALAQGLPLARALLLANCAGALSTLSEGPATCPPREQVEAAAKALTA